jgi:hypothetical protein
MKKRIKDYVGRQFDVTFSITVRTNGFNNWAISVDLSNAKLVTDINNWYKDFNALEGTFYTNSESTILNLYNGSQVQNKEEYLFDNFGAEIEDILMDFLQEEFPRFYQIDEETGEILDEAHFRSQLEEFVFNQPKLIDTWKK